MERTDILSFYLAKKKIADGIRKTFVDPNDRVVDIGSGIQPDYHQIIKGSLTTFDTVEKKRHVHVSGTMERLPFPDKSFDKVISINALYFTTDPPRTFREIVRVLKPAGTAYLVTPFMHPIHDVPHDRYRFTEFALKSFLEKGCKGIEIVPIGGIFSFPLIFLRSSIRGVKLIFPKYLRTKILVLLLILLFPLIVIAQLLTFLDIMDISRRAPLYYIVIAKKK